MDGEATLCACHVQGTCGSAGQCPLYHADLPYQWQARLDVLGWVPLDEVSIQVEDAFCRPSCISCIVQVPVVYRDGSRQQTGMQVDFENMSARVNHRDDRQNEQGLMKIRRLSTPSYAHQMVGQYKLGNSEEGQEGTAGFCCPWRWYYDNGTSWFPFDEDGLTPMQCVVEAKYLAGQKVFRFEVDIPDSSDSPLVFLLNYQKMKVYNLSKGIVGNIRRRPLFVSREDVEQKKFPQVPPLKPIPYNIEPPENWYPVNLGAEYELVPMSPDSLDFHLVASEFMKTSLPNRTIKDIYRLQNPFLWHKYHCKKLHMDQKFVSQKLKNKSQDEKTEEVLLFHGTSQDTSVLAIFKQNFDWRLAGKNATIYGRGSYFARDAAFSDKYTGPSSSSKLRWMFLARVLVGAYVKGNKDYVRPPPIDPSKPHGHLYDSCVDSVTKPTIYVIFDNDQCYPEYAICYER